LTNKGVYYVTKRTGYTHTLVSSSYESFTLPTPTRLNCRFESSQRRRCEQNCRRLRTEFLFVTNLETEQVWNLSSVIDRVRKMSWPRFQF